MDFVQIRVQPSLQFSFYFMYKHICLYCNQPLDGKTHAFNHFNKFHRDYGDVTYPRHFVWFQDIWCEVSRDVYFAAKKNRRPTALVRKAKPL
jgi:hypothetical protein